MVAMVAKKGEINTKIKLDPGAYMPVRAHQSDAGLDLMTPKSFWLYANNKSVIDTGVHVQIPEGMVGLITSKSGLMAKGVTCRGAIDSGYTGSIRAVLFNHSDEGIPFEAGQKVCQLVVLPCVIEDIELVNSLEETDRGDAGFGSTGK